MTCGDDSSFDIDECDGMWDENEMLQTIVAETIDPLWIVQEASAYAENESINTKQCRLYAHQRMTYFILNMLIK